MGFFDLLEVKASEKEAIIMVIGNSGTGSFDIHPTFECPSCHLIQKFFGYSRHRCSNCGQEVGVCNVHGSCDLSFDY